MRVESVGSAALAVAQDGTGTSTAQATDRVLPAGTEPARSQVQPREAESKVDQAVERLNKMADLFAVALRFSVDKETDRIVVRMIDSQTGELIRQIPPQQLLDIAAKMQEVLGVLFDAKA